MDLYEDDRFSDYTSSDLHVAIYSKNYEVLINCVKNKKIIDSFWRGCTPVSSALYLKQHDLLEILVENGANCNLRTRNNKMEPPLFAACRLRDKRAFAILFHSPTLDIDQEDFFGRTSLWAAARYSTPDMVEFLLNKGAKLNHTIGDIHPINGVLYRSLKHSCDILHIFIRYGSLLDATCKQSLLKLAVKNKDRKTFCLLVSAGCKVVDEEWLIHDKLPTDWKKDAWFTDWIDFQKRNPASLQNLTIWLIRKVLGMKYFALHEQHVKRLGLPNHVNSLILLSKFFD